MRTLGGVEMINGIRGIGIGNPDMNENALIQVNEIELQMRRNRLQEYQS